MAENVSQQLFNSVIKASLSEKKSNFDDCGVVIDWNLNEDVLRGTFAIPIQKIVNATGSGCTLSSKDFLNYLGE